MDYSVVSYYVFTLIQSKAGVIRLGGGGVACSKSESVVGSDKLKIRNNCYTYI